MSTFTNVLQQRINALQNQIRNLQEQNNNLRRRARYLLEAASTDMLMVPTADTQTSSQDPLHQYGGANPDQRYTMSTTAPGPGIKGLSPMTDPRFTYSPGPPHTWTYTDETTGTTYVMIYQNGRYILRVTNDRQSLEYEWYGGSWQINPQRID
jgi:hypothetical protein